MRHYKNLASAPTAGKKNAPSGAFSCLYTRNLILLRLLNATLESR